MNTGAMKLLQIADRLLHNLFLWYCETGTVWKDFLPIIWLLDASLRIIKPLYEGFFANYINPEGKFRIYFCLHQSEISRPTLKPLVCTQEVTNGSNGSVRNKSERPD